MKEWQYGCCAAILISTQSVWAGIGHQSLDFSVQARSGKLSWNIASDITGTNTPNVLSELTWDSLVIIDNQVRYRIEENRFVGIAEGHLGWMIQGDNQDSDYNGNERTLEFSRSNNASDGKLLIGASGGLGYLFDLSPNFSITPMAGLSWERQDLNMTKGVQTIPATGSFSGLDSRYIADWVGGWIGAMVNIRGERFSLDVESRLIKHEFYAEANWNLRNDLKHPKSFEHEAKGTAATLSAKLMYQLKNPKAKVGLSADIQAWDTDPGTDTTFFANGNISRTRLNAATWDTWSLALHYIHTF